MTDYTYSRVAALNFNTTPVTVGRSATGSVYAITDTTFTTPLSVTMVVGGAVTTTVSSDANGFIPDFVVANRPSVVFKQSGSSFTSVLTTTDPVPGPTGANGAAGATGAQGPRGDLASWQTATFYPLNQVISSPTGVLMKVTTAHTSGASYDASKFAEAVADRLQDAALNVTYGKKVGVSLADYATLKAAIAALPSTGGIVYVPVGRYAAGDWTYDLDYMNKANVRIIGEKMPTLSSNADRLENGSVIYGRFNVFADGFEASDVGFDMGKYVIDTFYPGKTTLLADHPLGGTWDAFAFAQPNQGAPLTARKHFAIRNVIGLLYKSESLGHAVLMEGINGGTADNVIGVGGVHAVVVKSQNMRMGRLSGWAASTNNVIFKADTYAACGNLSADYVEALRNIPGVTPWFTAAIASYGLQMNPSGASFNGPVQVGKLKVLGADKGLAITGGATLTVADVQIGEMVADGASGTMTSGIDFWTCRALRFQIGKLIVNNAAQGIAWAPATVGDNGEHQLHIGSAQLTNTTTRAINASLYGRIRIDSLEIATTPYAYYCDDNARIIIGKETLISVTNRWERNNPTLATGWTNFGGGNSTWAVMPENYGLAIKGLLSAGAGVTGTIASLPVYMRPIESKRLPGYLNVGGARQYALIGVDTGGNIVINDGTAPADGNYASVDGLGWQHW